MIYNTSIVTPRPHTAATDIGRYILIYSTLAYTIYPDVGTPSVHVPNRPINSAL